MTPSVFFFYRQYRKQILFLSALLIGTLSVLVLFRAFTFAQSLIDPAVGKESEILLNQVRIFQEKIDAKQTETKAIEPKYGSLIESVFPSEVTTEKMVSWMNQLVGAAGPDIVLTNIVFQRERIEKKEDYTIYPVKATFKLSRDALARLSDILAHSGTLTQEKSGIIINGERIFLPLIQIQKTTLLSDFTTQYDQSGTKLKTSIPVEFELLLYGA